MGAVLAHADLSEANLAGANLLGANLERSQLHDTHWDTTQCPDGSLSDANGATCGGHLSPQPPPCPIAPNAPCQRADLSGLDLSFANLRGAVLRGADLRGTLLRGANLEGATLDESSLAGADLSDANLTSASTKRLNSTNFIGLRTICTDAQPRAGRTPAECLGSVRPQSP